MTIRSELKKILDIVADLAENDVKKDVLETGIIAHSGLSDFEVRNHLNELEWLRLVKEALPRSSHADFRLWSITEKGLQELSTELAVCPAQNNILAAPLISLACTKPYLPCQLQGLITRLCIVASKVVVFI
jgi:hypothetical protein